MFEIREEFLKEIIEYYGEYILFQIYFLRKTCQPEVNLNLELNLGRACLCGGGLGVVGTKPWRKLNADLKYQKYL